jgi:hypothetical protein
VSAASNAILIVGLPGFCTPSADRDLFHRAFDAARSAAIAAGQSVRVATRAALRDAHGALAGFRACELEPEAAR